MHHDSDSALRHGEAVALGLLAAARVSFRLGVGPDLEPRLRALFAALGLPTDLDARLGDGALAPLAVDKKRAAGNVRFIVLDSPGHARLVPLALDQLAALLASPRPDDAPRRIVPMTRTLLATAVVCAGLAGGCVDNNDSLTIVQDQVIDHATTQCGVPATATTNGRSQGLLDLALVEAGFDGYQFYPLVRNDIVPPATAQGADNDVTIEGCDVQLIGGPALAAVPSDRRTYHIDTLGANTPPQSFSSAAFTLVPRDIALDAINLVKAQFSAQGGATTPPVDPNAADFLELDVKLRMTGTRAGTGETSGWITFPVFLCYGCLVGPVDSCPAAGFSSSDVQLGSCNPAQDDAITCCEGNSNDLLCGGAVPMS